MSDKKEIEKKVNLEGFAAHVELPEGHQLVLGELPPGTVVEVATWQGTGRPDETTNRFLLSASGPGLQRRQRREENTQIENEDRAAIETRTENPAEVIEKPSLGSVGGSNSYLGMRTFGVSSPAQVEVKKSSARTFGRAVFTLVAIIAIAVMTLSLLGISATVPTRGIKTTFGASTSSLVVYKRSASVDLGVATVARVTKNGVTETLFGPSNSFDAQTIQIETSAGQELVSADAVSGRAFLAIPFIGTLFKYFVS